MYFFGITLILFLPAIQICIGYKPFKSYAAESPAVTNISLPIYNTTFPNNDTVFFSSRIIILVPEIQIQTKPNDLFNFGSLLQALFGFSPPQSNITEIQNKTYEDDWRDLYEFWNSKHVYNSTNDTLKNTVEHVNKVYLRSIPEECNNLMCKEHGHLQNMTKDFENVTEVKVVRSLDNNLKENFTENSFEQQSLNDELFEFTTNKEDLTSITSDDDLSKLNFSMETNFGVFNETLPNNISSTKVPSQEKHNKRDINCDEISGCLTNTTSYKLETTSAVSNLTSKDTKPFKYKDWLWHHIESVRNGSLKSNSSGQFLKRHHFLFNSGGTGKSATAKSSELFLNDEVVDGKQIRHKRTQKLLPKYIDDIEIESFIAEQFRQKDLEVPLFDLKVHDEHIDQGPFHVEKEYNEGSNQPTKPLLLFVTIPSCIGISVFILALCYLTRSGGWCCRLFQAPPRSNARAYLPKVSADLSQATSA